MREQSAGLDSSVGKVGAMFQKIGEVIMMRNVVGRGLLVEGRDSMSKELVQDCRQARRSSGCFCLELRPINT